MKKLAISISPEGVVEELDITTDSLKVLQTAVGGYIEAVDIDPSLTMWVNEEFLFFSEPAPNAIGTVLFSHVGGNYAIQGTIVMTGGTDAEGNTMGLSSDDAASILRIVEDAHAFHLV